MRIALTGASSFTGMWFAETLVREGHDVLALLRRPRSAYSGLRAERVARVEAVCSTEWDVVFGSERFQSCLAAGGRWDILCHHAAEVADYRNPDFDVVAALHANTRGLARLSRCLAAAGCGRLVLTGSVFEPDEGAGPEPRVAFSPYGLAKGLTARMFSFYAARDGFALGKFVIPNPFGPFEEPRFTDYLVRSWAAGEVPRVGTPAYVRDNIHVTLLAQAYADFVTTLPGRGEHRCNPAGYVENQRAFALRFARELGPRLGLPCPVEFADQTQFAEPWMRVNTQPAAAAAAHWNEARAWDELAAYYRARFLAGAASPQGSPA